MSKKIRPKMISLEASSICQLRCPSCPNTSKAILPTVGSGFLQLSDFRKLIDENPWIKKIELSNYGEIFLNSDILEIIKHAYKRKVALTADIGVNLNNVKSDVLEGLVKYKLRSMVVSIDGASNETYTQYRIRGNYNRVIENIKQINLFKKQYQSKYPLLTWQYVIFGFNEHELPMTKKLADELNMIFSPKLSWDAEFSPVVNREVIRKELGVATRDEYKEKYGVDYSRSICHQLWERPQINWDGKVLGCCRNFWGDFGGNVFTDGILECLNNEKINYARNMLLGHQEARDDIPCATCEIYLDMKKKGNWLKRGAGRLLYSSLIFLTPPTVKHIIKRYIIKKLLYNIKRI
jgi:MoaA/NifB/PqqE/SkfB family radical SAM enzyme